MSRPTPSSRRLLALTLGVLFPCLLVAGEDPTGTVGQVEGELARRVFERFRDLEGRWSARSSQGWQGEYEIRVLAKGSVVASTTRFPDAPTHTMQTMIHLDGGRLLLTHYCEAGNQPRLVLSQASDDARQATFSFLDATNLPTRDHGHMDKAIVHFVDDDHVTSRWTWYANGEERWLEEIVRERIAGGVEKAR